MNEKRSKLQHMWKYMFLCVFVFSIALSANAQNRTVKGVITNVDNEALVGVTVMVPNTTIGTATDADGKFNFKIPEGTEKLHITFIGFKARTIFVKWNKTMFITLEEEVSFINEVQVSALGMNKAVKKTGYAATEVKGEELAKLDVVNPVVALQGQVAGLSVNASDGGLFGSARIQLRGASVLGSGDNQPIFVVDGFIQNVGSSGYNVWGGGYAGDWGSVLKNMDMSIVESVTVLKGAAATALYGSRGINGAIVVKTKGADSALRGLGVTIKQTLGITDPYRSMDFQYVYGPGESSPGYVRNSSGNKFNTQDYLYDNDGNVNVRDNYSGSCWGSPYDANKLALYHDGELRPYTPIKDHHLRAFQKGYTSETHISVNGGNEKTRFFISETFTEKRGIYFGNELNKNSFKLSGNHKLNEFLSVGGDITVTRSKPRNPNNSIGYQYHWGSFDTMYDAKEWGKREICIAEHGGVSGASGNDKYASIPGNGAWFDYFTHTRDRDEDLMLYKGFIEVKPTKWLSIKGEYLKKRYDISFQEKKLSSGYANGGKKGFYKVEKSTDAAETFRLTANFEHKLNSDWFISGLMAGERWESNYERISAETFEGLIIPNKFYLNNSKSTIKGGDQFDKRKRINSIYGLLTVDYKDQAFLEFTGRNDWSSTLTYRAGKSNNSYFYPSVSLSWLANKTFRLPDWIDMSKLRVSRAKVGNDTGVYWLNPAYSTSSSQYHGSNTYFTGTVNEMIDPNIKPQMKKSWEYGLDVRLFKNRIGLDLAWYDDITYNQIGSVGLDDITGFGRIRTNIGTLGNKGFEAALNVVPIRKKDFEVETQLKYWTNSNVVKELHEAYNGIYGLGGNAGSGHFHSAVIGREGGAYGEVISTCTEKIYKNEDDPNDPLNGKKLIGYYAPWHLSWAARSGETEKVGNVNPDFEGSIYTSIRYKNFKLSFLIDATIGGTIASHEARYGMVSGQSKESLAGRAPEYGGIKFTSTRKEDMGVEYGDGVIFDDSYVFKGGSKGSDAAGNPVDISGMTMQEAIDAGAIDPNHAGLHYSTYVGWGNGVVSDLWLKEKKIIALRNISFQYTVGSNFANKIGAKSIDLILNIRNPFYIYNNLPNHVNPESIRGNDFSSYYTQSNVPYTRQFTFSITASF